MLRQSARRSNTRKKPITRLSLPVVKILVVFCILGLVTYLALKINFTEFLQVTIRWNIDTRLVIEKNVLEDRILPIIENKYALDLQAIKHILELEPWIANARIERLLFNSIQIKIKAHKVAMRWQNSNCKNQKARHCRGYISTQGMLFRPEKLIPANAVLAISKPDELVVAQLYQDYQRYQALSKPMIIKSFSKTNIDQLVFASGVKVVLGYQQQNQRFKNFIKAYHQLKNKNSKVKRAVFDMRYPKGFTLKY